MKIDTNDIFNENTINLIQKTINQLSAGDKFKATIIDIKPDLVSLRLSDNTVLNAKSLIIPDARIGQEATFIVKENLSGQIFLEMKKTDESSPASNVIKEILRESEMPVIKENADLVKALIDNNMPVDKNTLQKAAFFKYSDTNAQSGNLNNNIDKILFLLKENFPAEKMSVDVLNNIIKNDTTMKNNLIKVTEDILNLNNYEIKNSILKLFDFNDEEIKKLDNKQIYDKIKSKFFLKINKSEDIETVENHFNNIKKISKEIDEILSKFENTNLNLKNSIQNLNDNMDFVKNINNYKEFIQIPVNVNNKDEQCDVYVFKNNKHNKTLSENASVLVSLNMPFLGKTETFIDKSNKVLSFQFRAENNNVLSLIQNKINKLALKLKQMGYSISSITYKNIDEPFNILSESINKNKNETKVNNVNKRYSFDMRV